MQRIIAPNGQPAVPSIDLAQIAVAMVVNGRHEELPPAEQAKDICDRAEAIFSEMKRRNSQPADHK